MYDLDLVRELRADVPAPSPARVAAGRERLITETAAPAQRVRRPRRALLPIGLGAIAVGAAAAVAVAVTVVASGTHPSSTAGSSPAGTTRSSSHPKTGAPISLAAQVLTTAANKVASERVARPSAGQWIYSKLFQSQTGVATQLTENWGNFDSTRQARLQDGKLVVRHITIKGYNTPLDAYNALAALPSSPAAIRAAVDRAVGTTPAGWLNWSRGNPAADFAPRNQGQAEFDYLAEMLWVAYAAAPAEAEAHVYETMSAIPGVIVDTHAATAAGQPAIGVSDEGGASWIYLDPQTYQLIGLRVKATPFMKSTASGPSMSYGTIAMAYEKVALVDGPGDR